MYYLEQTAGIPGMAKLLGRIGRTGFVREYIPGCHLREYRQASKPGQEFYTELQATLTALHARGMSHNDLSKPENILVRPDGRPVVIDLQIAATFRSRVPIVKQSGTRFCATCSRSIAITSTNIAAAIGLKTSAPKSCGRRSARGFSSSFTPGC